MKKRLLGAFAAGTILVGLAAPAAWAPKIFGLVQSADGLPCGDGSDVFDGDMFFGTFSAKRNALHASVSFVGDCGDLVPDGNLEGAAIVPVTYETGSCSGIVYRLGSGTIQRTDRAGEKPIRIDASDRTVLVSTDDGSEDRELCRIADADGDVAAARAANILNPRPGTDPTT